MKKGHQFQSESDTEVILAAYVEWGEKCLNKFNGMWALAIWDKEKKELFLNKTKAYVMPKERSIDIDDELDFRITDFLMHDRERKER